MDSFWRKATEVLKGSPLKAIYFAVDPYKLQQAGKPSYAGEPSKVTFEGTLMTSEAFFTVYSPTKRESDGFSYDDGAITATAKQKWSRGARRRLSISGSGRSP